MSAKETSAKQLAPSMERTVAKGGGKICSLLLIYEWKPYYLSCRRSKITTLFPVARSPNP